LGAVLGWPLFMSLIVIAASMLGIVTGEWKQSGRKPLAVQLVGVAVLILAIFILATASQALA
jgi:L-rhamnose-H+ transport protein